MKQRKGRRDGKSDAFVGDVPPRLLRSTLFLVLQVIREAARLRDERFPEAKLRFVHRGILACLEESGPCSQTDVARRLRVDASDLVKAIDALESWGMVLRRRDTADRRRQILELTPAGKRGAAEHDLVVDAANELLLGALTKAERKAFHAMLERIRARLVVELREGPRR